MIYQQGKKFNIMDADKPFKEGYLLFPPQGVLGQLKKKSWHKKYCQLFKASKNGIERLEVFDNEEEVRSSGSVRIITLESCIKITLDAQKHQPHVFIVVTKTAVFHFATSTDSECGEWLSAFQAVAFTDDTSRQTIEEDNDLYCSAGEGVFSVRLVTSDASQRCGLSPGPYTLVVTPSALQLREPQAGALLFTWPYPYIRRYGYRDGKFTFEAGRKCVTGEGSFQLEHSHRQEIFRCISAKMRNMRKLLEPDGGLVAALGMGPRSRSPLPLSICTSVSEISMTMDGAVGPPYDHVEVRQAAWRTLGVAETPHSECTPSESDASDTEIRLPAPAPVQRPHPNLEDYDRLQYMGSASRLNAGYRQLPVVTPRAPEPPVTPVWSDYDKVDPMTRFRVADDSHHGYGMIRKKSTPEHSVYNEQEYAVVLKPKRV